MILLMFVLGVLLIYFGHVGEFAENRYVEVFCKAFGYFVVTCSAILFLMD